MISTKNLVCKSNLLARFFSSARKVEEVFIVSCARTPLGSMGGALKDVTAPQLGSIAIKGAVEKAGINLDSIEEVMMGCVLQAGIGQAPARQAALGAGASQSTPCTTINKVCASGMKAISSATAELSLGHRGVMVAGGMESLSNTPFTLKRGQTPYGGIKLTDTCNHDGLTDAYTGWHMGKCAEEMAVRLNINRERQDDYGILSYKRAESAFQLGIYENEIVPVTVKKGKMQVAVSKDEEVARCNYDTFRRTRTYWGETVGVGSSSKLADGAAATVLMNETALNKYDLKPLARIVDYGDAATNPTEWPIAPAIGVKEILHRNTLTVQDISLWEINEAFAMVVLANGDILDIDIEKVNKNGGAIAIGHPFGMSGARITNHLALNLKKGELGIATLCNGGGGAGTILLEGM